MDVVVAELHRRLARGEGAILCTVVRTRGSTPRKAAARMVVDPVSGQVVAGTVGGGRIEHEVVLAALELYRRGQNELIRHHLTRGLGMCCGGEMEVFVEPFVPAARLVIFGGGHVAAALAPLGKSLGFHVTVVDELDEFASGERFPSADVLINSFAPSDWKELPFDAERSYLVIVTRDHRVDEDLLETLAPRDWAYLGMIGSRAKVARFRTRLEAKGVAPGLLDRVHMPIGLDIGAQTPAEIAVAICAELVQVRREVEARRGAARPPGEHDEGCQNVPPAVEGATVATVDRAASEPARSMRETQVAARTRPV